MLPSRILSIVLPNNDAVGGQPRYEDTLDQLLALTHGVIYRYYKIHAPLGKEIACRPCVCSFLIRCVELV